MSCDTGIYAIIKIKFTVCIAVTLRLTLQKLAHAIHGDYFSAVRTKKNV